MGGWIDRRTDGKIGMHAGRHADKQTDIQTDRQTDRQACRQTDRQTYIYLTFYVLSIGQGLIRAKEKCIPTTSKIMIHYLIHIPLWRV